MHERPLDNENTADAKASTNDVKVGGNPDAWVLICKASSKGGGWMKSTKAMDVGHGVVVQVTTEHRDLYNGNARSVAEALTFVPGATIVVDRNGAKAIGTRRD